jgi:CBS domain-containing protein
VASLIYPYGVFDAVMKVKKMPYLDHEGGHNRYDAIEVGDILADCPLETVRPRMQAHDLVELLEKSKHNGFPVVDATTKKYLGLVRRDQIAALLECGVFDKSIGGSQAWARPESGLDKTPLMRTYIMKHLSISSRIQPQMMSRSYQNRMGLSHQRR